MAQNFLSDIQLGDNIYIRLGDRTFGDLNLYHNGTNSFIDNHTGNVYIRNFSDDKNIHLQSDDGSGGMTDYIVVHGSENIVKFQEHTRHLDNKEARFGTGSDLKIYHDGTNSYLDNARGDLYVRNDKDDGDIIFQSDDGSGGLATYFYLDGGSVNTRFVRHARFTDGYQLQLGNSADMAIFHSGTNSFIQNATGDLYIDNDKDDGDIIFRSDDGGGGKTTYFALDGGLERNIFYKTIRINGAGAGYLKTDANGDVSIDTSTIEDTLQTVTDRGASTDNAITISTSTNRTLTLDYTSGTGSYSLMSFKQSGTEQFRLWGSYTDNYLSFYNDQASVHQLKLNSDGSTAFDGNIKLALNSIIQTDGNSDNFLDFDDDSTTHNADTNVTTLGSISGIAMATNLNDGGGGDFTVSTGSTGTELFKIAVGGDATFSGNLYAPEYIYHKGNTTTYARFQTNRLTLHSGGGAVVDLHSNGQLYFTGASTFYSNATFAGTVTVGTGTVAAANAAADDFVITGPGTTATGMTISNTSDAGTGTIFFGDSTSSSAAGFRYNHNTGDMAISAEDNITFACDNVGIGTTSPASKLNISDGTIYSLKLSNTSAYNSGINNGVVFNGKYNSSGNTTDMASIRGGKDTINDTDFGGKLTFHTRLNGGSDTERARIDQNGNFALGTTSPDAIFHVAKANSGGVGGQIVIDNPTSSALGNAVELSFLTDIGASGSGTRNAKILAVNENVGNGAANIQFWTWNGSSEGERMRIDSSGNVGIGTGANIDTKFHVEETTANTSCYATVQSASWDAGLTLKNSNATWEILNDFTGLGTTGALAFYQGGYRMVIDSGGQVGIGTTSPGDILHVSKSAANTRLVIGNNSAYDQYIYFQANNDWSMGIDNSNSNAFTLSNYSSIGTNTRLTVTTAGDVGIGTDDPAAKLEIMQNGGAIIRLHDPGDNSWKIKADADFHIYDDSNTDYLTITNAGNATFAGRVKGTNFTSVENSTDGGFSSTRDYLLAGTGDRGGGLIINDISGARFAMYAGGYDLTFTKETDDGAGTLSQDIWMRANAADAASNVSSIDFLKESIFAGDVTVSGNLIVTGNTTSVNVEDLNVEQGEITLNYGTGDTSAAANGSGIRIQDAVNATTDATILWDAAGDKFDFSHGATFGAKVQADSWFQGNSATNLLWSSSSLGVYLQTPGLTANNNNSKIFFRNSGGTVKHTFDTNSGDATFVGRVIIGDDAITTDKPGLVVGDTTNNGQITIRGGQPTLFFDKSGTNDAVILTDGVSLKFKNGTLDSEGSDQLTLDTSGNAIFAGDVNINGGDLTVGNTTNNGTVTIRSLDSSSSTRTAALDFNIAGTHVAGLTLHNNTSGIATNTLAYDFQGSNKLFIFSDGGIQTEGKGVFGVKVQGPIFYDSTSTTYYLDPAATGTSLNVAGGATIAGDITAPGQYGESYSVDSTSGTVAIIDTVTLTAADHHAVYEVVAVGNPNAAGSSLYRDIIFGKIIVSHGYTNPNVLRYIHFVRESPLPRDMNTSGTSSNLTMEVVFWDGSSESETFTSNSGTPTIRVKIDGYNSSHVGASTSVRLKRIM